MTTLTRRALLASSSVLAASTLLPAVPAEAAAGDDPCDHVDPFIGTGGHGHTYPGATVPFGMVQLSPDTSNKGWDSCGGYHQKDGSIMGFSHTHLSGTGCADMLDLLVVPRTGPVILNPGEVDAVEGSYRSRYDRASEVATPGYYKVRLDSGIEAELTATTRTGLHRYTFPKGKPGHLLIDWAHAQRNWWEKDPKPHIESASLKWIAPDTLVGARQISMWANKRWIFFALKLSRPPSRVEMFRDDAAVAAQAIEGTYLKAALHFDDAGHAPLLVRAGISAVDIDGALRNLGGEMPGFDFDRVRAAARTAWEKELGQVRVEGDPTYKRIFYSAHYHAMLAPTVFSDVDRRYRGMDNQVHTLEAGAENYSTWSLWDTYRALHPFYTLAHSERLPGMMQALVRMGQESPLGAPIWPLQGRETDTMIGYHSASVLAEAYVKRVPGVDWRAAYAVMRKRAFVDDVHGLKYYRELGYIPADKEGEAVSKTLEYSYCDFATSKLADAVGAHDEAEQLRKRSRNYRNTFDPSIHFMRGRYLEKSWATPFAPDSLGHDQKQWRDFTESNSWQATFLNQHDVNQYMTLFGGPQGFEQKLDGLFNASSAMTNGSTDDITGLVGQYAHGNEPSHHVAYLYAYSGSHHKTQARVRMLMETMYSDKPDGLIGNEDCGQMSAWYLMSALGFYAVDPQSGLYVFGTPLFQRVTLAVGGGRTLVIEAPAVSAENKYIRGVTLNGKPYTRSYVAHRDLIAGGTLHFDMASTPNPAFGREPEDRPPSFV